MANLAVEDQRCAGCERSSTFLPIDEEPHLHYAFVVDGHTSGSGETIDACSWYQSEVLLATTAINVKQRNMCLLQADPCREVLNERQIRSWCDFLVLDGCQLGDILFQECNLGEWTLINEEFGSGFELASILVTVFVASQGEFPIVIAHAYEGDASVQALSRHDTEVVTAAFGIGIHPLHSADFLAELVVLCRLELVSCFF